MPSTMDLIRDERFYTATIETYDQQLKALEEKCEWTEEQTYQKVKSRLEKESEVFKKHESNQIGRAHV